MDIEVFIESEHECELPAVYFDFELREDDQKSLTEYLKKYKAENDDWPDRSEYDSILYEVCPHISDEIEQKAEIAAKEALEQFVSMTPERIGLLAEMRDPEDWFSATVVEYIDYRNCPLEDIDEEDLLTDLDEFIVPESEDFEDPEEFEQEMEWRTRFSERDQAQLVTRKAAKRTVKRILEYRREQLENLFKFFTRTDHDAIIDTLIEILNDQST